MTKFSKRQSMTLFILFLIGLPIAIHAMAPPIRSVCATGLFLEEDPDPVVP